MLVDEIRSQMKSAMKERNSFKRNLLSSVLGDLDKAAKDQMIEKALDEQVIKLCKKYISNCEENIKSCPAKAQEFSKEIDILEQFIPEQFSEEKLRLEIEKIIKDENLSGKSTIGIVMKELKNKFPGQFDGKMASKIVQEII